MTYSFDGKGINDKRSEYAPRMATFANAEYAEEFGNLYAAAPELLKFLQDNIEFIPPMRQVTAHNILAKAKGE